MTIGSDTGDARHVAIGLKLSSPDGRMNIAAIADSSMELYGWAVTRCP
jgi:hypothetical protein